MARFLLTSPIKTNLNISFGTALPGGCHVTSSGQREFVGLGRWLWCIGHQQKHKMKSNRNIAATATQKSHKAVTQSIIPRWRDELFEINMYYIVLTTSQKPGTERRMGKLNDVATPLQNSHSVPNGRPDLSRRDLSIIDYQEWLHFGSMHRDLTKLHLQAIPACNWTRNAQTVTSCTAFTLSLKNKEATQNIELLNQPHIHL